MKSLSLKISTYSISKLFLVCYLAYNAALVNIGIYVPRLSIILLIASGVFALMAERESFRFYNPKEFRWLICFIAVSAVTGLLLADNKSIVIQKTLFLLEVLIVIYLICFLAIRTGEADVVPLAFFIGSVILSVYLLLGNGTLISYRLSLSDTFNSNTLGVYLMFGGWSMLKIFDKIKLTGLSLFLSVAGSALLFYIIIQTGSRKATIGFTAIFLLWLIFGFRVKMRQLKVSVKVISFVILVLSVIFVVYRYQSDFYQASETILRRMQALENSEGSWTVRIDLILDALKVFVQNPVFGVGFDNYRFLSVYSMYSHNTYSELLACTGIVGTFFFFTLLLTSLKPIVSRLLNGIKNRNITTSDVFNVSLAVVFLAICMTQICFYNQNLMTILAQIMATSILIRTDILTNEN